MYHEQLAREAKLIALGHQAYVAEAIERWEHLLYWLGLRG